MTQRVSSLVSSLGIVRCSLLAVAATLVAACAKHENAELQWARAALQRNPNIEIVAADEQSGVFTVRDRETGTVSTVAMQDLGAAPVSQLIPRALPPAVATAPMPAAPVVPEPAAQTPPAQTAAEQPSAPERPEVAPPVEAASATNAKNYTIERTDGQLKVSGPGISIVSAGTAAQTASDRQGPRPVDPIICEGPRMLHFDNRNIYVEGDAITVRGGCELYITNSNIIASGTGVMVHDGIVHIANSYVEGAASSFDADSQAKVFVRGSIFQGLSRRDQLATVQDQGGNQWK